ncbi:MAG: SDR family NAD(P)-dependent oxidoreductase [Planctomycetota bacterium]|nr:MAG: SDR family NAD(P)-dependent oxidoreductase [Planctomycetota bacterium]
MIPRRRSDPAAPGMHAVSIWFPSRRLDPGAALVTGAASGLGRALVESLFRAGWRVAATDLPEALQAARLDAGILALPLDVRDAVAWRDLRDRLRSDWPTLDLLVNAAGVGATGEVGTLPEAQWRRVLDTNLLGTALGCETFLPWLREHPRRSHVVNVASIAAILSVPSMAAYSASKAGVVALSEAIAAECARGRPGVTVVCPGFFRSGLLGTWHFTSSVERREAERRMAVTRWTSERVAGRVLRAVHRNRRYVVVGLRARWLWRLKRLAPRAATALVRRVYRRLPR